MKKTLRSIKSAGLLLFALQLAVFSCLAGSTVTNLRCEYRDNPLGIDTAAPRLSWQMQSDERGQKQTAYRVLVASSEAGLSDNVGDLWDSGRVASGQSFLVTYAGKPLAAISLQAKPYTRMILFNLSLAKDSAEEKAFNKKTMALGKLPGAENFTWITIQDQKTNFTCGVRLTFTDTNATRAYVKHRRHVAYIRDVWKPAVREFQMIDYTESAKPISQPESAAADSGKVK